MVGFLVAVLLAGLIPELAAAQSPLRVFGSTGITARGYTVSGIDNRRAPTALEAFGRVSFDLAGLSSGLNLSYSTDQSGVRQSINRLSFRTAWSSGQVAIGDVTPSFSQYSLRGVTTRGGSLEQSIGPVFLGFAGGRSRRAVDVSRLGDFRGASFSRYVFGSRLGVGRPDGTHFHLIAVYGKDIPGSLEDAGSLKPKEHISLTPVLGLSLFDGAVELAGEVTGSVFTVDRTAPEEETVELPPILDAVITPRQGTRLDFATSVEASVNTPTVGVTTSFSRIQPGFESLGLQQIRSDEQTIRVAPRASLAMGRVNVSGSVSRSENNLAGDLSTTLLRDQLDASLQFQVLQSLSLSLAGNLLRNEADPVASTPQPELQQKQMGSTVMVAPAWFHQSTTGTAHTATLSLSRQQFEDKSDAVVAGTRPGFESTNNAFVAAYSLRLPSSLSITLTGNLVSSEASSSDATIRTGTLSLGYSFSTDFNATVTGGWSGSDLTVPIQDEIVEQSSTQWSGGLTASYSVSAADAIRLQIRATANRSSQDFGDFEEVQSSLTYTHRF